jgi:uncharacterized protein YjbJ (UPF0337 family)
MQIGNLTGATSWQKSGKEEHTTGEAEYNAAQAKGYVEGTSDRIQGYKDSVVGAITGDKTQQTQGMHPHCEYGQGYWHYYLSGNLQKEKGSAQQEMNKPTTGSS